jgi:predicted NBD/HSP70 family sugar kinase/mannose-6-phosphate isomerase class I
MFKHLHMKIYLGLDIGGTHVAGALVDGSTGALIKDTYYRDHLDAAGRREDILEKWRGVLDRVRGRADGSPVAGIGVAMPGPFDYENGVSRIRGLEKYDSLYGLDIRSWLTRALALPPEVPVVFTNDAWCFGQGEYWSGAGRGAGRMLAITLGTGFGATFLIHGAPQQGGAGVAPGGYLYNVPYKDGTAEEYFSSRGLVKAYRERTGVEAEGVKQLEERAAKGEPEAVAVLETFGSELGAFLAPWLRTFRADMLVIGGGISRASAHFLPALRDALSRHGAAASVEVSGLDDAAAIIGAAMGAGVAAEIPPARPAARASGQPMLPGEVMSHPEAEYDLYPTFPVDEGAIRRGWRSLADYIMQHPVMTIDGYQGVSWDVVRDSLGAVLAGRGVPVTIQDTREWFLPPEEISRMLAPYLGEEDSVWGRRCELELKDLFDAGKIAASRPVQDGGVHILMGPGAALAGWQGPVIYLEMPKNEIQYRMRAGSVRNLGAEDNPGDMQMYKRCYFVDWVLLNKHRRAILDRIGVVADCQHSEIPAWIPAQKLKEAVSTMTRNVFRARPWFEPGAWGGQWLKHHIPGIAQEEVNYAWSFELITPENGIVLESAGITLEVSFDYLMLYEAAAVLGPAFARRFGEEFPIRFDFLDTVRGGNLSIQCHPSLSYIREHFGERITQDETYYILEAEPDASVYLGFREDIDPGAFREALERSNREARTLQIEDYVLRHPAGKHDLFLIPNRTIHSAGTGNLVLEISATPYIFTFKMYDWLRLDLKGDPRPINIAHAFENLDFSRKGERVVRELISRPRQIDGGPGWKLFHLPTHPEHFYDVHRYEFTGAVTAETQGGCHVLMVVEGRGVTVETQGALVKHYAFGETFVIPAAAGRYRLSTGEGSSVKVVKAFLKPEAAGQHD